MTARPGDAWWTERAIACADRRAAARGRHTDLALLPPHASTRRYARVHFGGETEIVMLMPPEGPALDEVGSGAPAPIEHDPFIVVQRWLSGLDIPVVGLRDIDIGGRALWLEDLGDVDFDQWVSNSAPSRRAAYHAALGVLERFQRATAAAEPPDCVRERVFDAELLRWELEHYVEWRLEADLGVTPDPEQRKELDATFSLLVAELDAMPKIPMHRDFQSHNIMVVDDRPTLRLLDFQDAMTGPLVYDAVALLRDSYVTLDPSELDELVGIFAESAASLSAAGSADAAQVERWFHLQTVQRKLKDAGRFVYIDRVKGNPSFLRYIDDSVVYVRLALERLPELGRLRRVLSDLDPGLA